MHAKSYTQNSNQMLQAAELLRQLGFPCHRIGFSLLCVAIPGYRQTESVSLTKELYPDIAVQMQLTNWWAVERDIRGILRQAWNQRDKTVWEQFFPGKEKCPSNKQFLAVMAEYL